MLLRTYSGIEKTENGYLIKGDAADIKLIFLTDDIIRIRVSFDRSFREASYALVTTAWEDELDGLFREERTRIQAKEPVLQEKEECLVFCTETLKLVMEKSPLNFRLYSKEGELVYQDLKERAFDRDYLGRVTHYSEIDPEKDHFYGFGEKTGHLDKKGRHMRMSPKDAIGYDPEFGEPLYKHIPFYVRVNEEKLHTLGVFYNNSHDAVFDMGNERSGYWNSYCYYQAEGGDIDLFLLNGPDMASVLERYTWLTGRPAMPTKQSLGFTASTMYYAELEKDCDQEIYKVMQKHFKEDIYIDNFWLASGYSSGEEDNLRYVFNWNKKRFPEPEKFFEKMEKMGINVIPNMKPGILENHPYRQEFEKQDAFVKTPDRKEDYVGRWWGGEGRFVDFTGEKGRRIWKELLKETLLKKGMKTVWNDNCEYDGIEDRNAFCEFEGMGGTMAELKIIHSNMMAYTGKQALEEVYPERRPYIINRAGFAGIQRYAQVWAGDNLTDWRTVKFNIATIMGMGLSGMTNAGCDIGGFAGPAPEGELLLRWIQNGIFQPRFCMNSANSDNTVTQPWSYEENLPYVKEAYALRYRMLPYLYSVMREASKTGMPVMRPLFLEFPQDIECYRDKNLTFMFGPAILVANVVEKGAATRKLYLPKGTTWYHMNDHFRAYQGGQTIEIPVDLGSVPMFLRGSGIFITSQDIKCITRDRIKTLEVLVSCEKDTAFTYYDDDGWSKEFEHGVYASTRISAAAGDKTRITFQKSGDYKEDWDMLHLNLVSREKGAYWVSADGEKLPRFLTKDSFLEAGEGWYYDMSNKIVRVKCRKPCKDAFEIIVSCEKFDLIGMEYTD